MHHDTSALLLKVLACFKRVWLLRGTFRKHANRHMQQADACRSAAVEANEGKVGDVAA